MSSQARPKGCECHWETGDSPCPVHGLCEMELAHPDSATLELLIDTDSCGEVCCGVGTANGDGVLIAVSESVLAPAQAIEFFEAALRLVRDVYRIDPADSEVTP